MKKRIITLTVALFGIGIMNFLHAQETSEILNWYNGKKGMRTEKAYKSLKKKKSTTVVVAIIDSGIDIEHKDLKGKIWTNDDEIPNNGIDDDKNGYIDDIHGWNFLGSAEGNQEYARLEKTRICAKLHLKYADKNIADVAEADKAEYKEYKKMYQEITEEREQYAGLVEQYKQIGEMLPLFDKKLKDKFGGAYTVKDIEGWKPTTPEEMQLKQIGGAMASGELTTESVEEALTQLSQMVDYNYNLEYDDRAMIGDNPDDMNDVKYGNNDVEGPDALHGTHVGGIVGAVRGNGLGGDGVAENIVLMSLRAVPNGDEADKDVALAIRYAVDNGAMVINMSFGKAYSAHQKEVYEAMKYAESKGVLLVHAAGNDGHSLDENPNYPTNEYSFQKEGLKNYLCIGASTRNTKSEIAASFSNYSPRQVDVFAPGFEIYNTVPQSEYKKLQGTSMAAPMVTGVAALLKSYFPSLTMMEIKDIILKSAVSHKGEMHVKPGSEEKVDFGQLSTTGATVDVPNAVKMCKALEASKGVK